MHFFVYSKRRLAFQTFVIMNTSYHIMKLLVKILLWALSALAFRINLIISVWCYVIFYWIISKKPNILLFWKLFRLVCYIPQYFIFFHTFCYNFHDLLVVFSLYSFSNIQINVLYINHFYYWSFHDTRKSSMNWTVNHIHYSNNNGLCPLWHLPLFPSLLMEKVKCLFKIFIMLRCKGQKEKIFSSRSKFMT